MNINTDEASVIDTVTCSALWRLLTQFISIIIHFHSQGGAIVNLASNEEDGYDRYLAQNASSYINQLF